MTPEKMFSEYRLLSPDTPDYTHCLFSEAADDILSGKLNLADIPYEVFACYGEELPQKDDVEVVTAADGSAICLVRITDVKMVPVGEGRGSLFFPEYAEAGAFLVEIGFRMIFS